MYRLLFKTTWPIALYVCLSATASAQSLSDDAQEFGSMWELTEERCALAIEDPITYANSLPSRDPDQSDEVSVTEDGTHIRVRHIVGGFAEEFWFADVGPYRRVECNHFFHDVDYNASPNQENARWNSAILEYMATRQELVLYGGAISIKDAIFNSGTESVTHFHYNVYPDVFPETRTQALFVDMLASTFIAAQTIRGHAPTVAEIFSATPLLTSETPASGATPLENNNFSHAVAICLNHMVDKAPLESFRENNFVIAAADEGTFEISAPGMSGGLAPLLPAEWCWLESDSLTQAEVADLVFELAQERFPSGLAGPAARGELANGCPSLSLAYAENRLAILEFRNAGFFSGCDDGELGGVLFR